jgi:hypothetical protein
MSAVGAAGRSNFGAIRRADRVAEDVMKRLGLLNILAVTLIAGSSSLAYAQEASPGVGVGSGVAPAPPGHRQPTAADVPANDSAAPAAPGTSQTFDTFGPALKALPKLDIQSTCKRAQPLSSGEKSAFQSCIDDEVRAQKELSHKWFKFKAAARSTCTQETRIGGAPSYVELVTCLELDQQAADARIENSKPLGTPSTSPAPKKPKRKT